MFIYYANQGGESLLSSIWNSRVARAVISDDINISIGGSVVGLIGMGGSYNVTILTRGKDAGIHFNRTVTAKVGAELGAGISFSRGWFVGNAQNGTYGDLLGSGAEAGGDIGVGNKQICFSYL